MGGKVISMQDVNNVSGHFYNFITWQTTWDFDFYFWFFGLQRVFLCSHQCEWLNPLVWTCQKLPRQHHTASVQARQTAGGACIRLRVTGTQDVGTHVQGRVRDRGGEFALLVDCWKHWGAPRTGAPTSHQKGYAKGESTLLGGDVHVTHTAGRDNSDYWD